MNSLTGSSGAKRRTGAGKRGNGEGTFRQRQNGTWEVRIVLPDGKRRSLYGKTRAEVAAKLRQATKDLDNGLDLSEGRQTVAQFLDRWLLDCARPKLRPRTFQSYEMHVKLHLKPGLGRHELSRLTPQHVQAVLNAKSAAGLSPKSVQNMRGVLRSALNRAMKWGLVSRNVAVLTDPPRSDHKPVQPLTADQARRFIEVTKDDRLGPLFHVAIASGLRQGELFGLRWEDVDLDAGVLRVRYAMQRVKGKPPAFVEPKTRLSRRTVTLPVSAVAALRVQRKRQVEERLLMGERWQDWGIVFASSVGTPLETSNVSGRLHKLLDAAGLPRQRFHDLRHCAASLLLAGGVAPRTIMGILGHSQISLTMNTYAHLSPSLERDAATALDAVLAAGA